MKFKMILKRILAGSILALLLSASSLGAACDLSCAFASMNSDCHSEHAQTNSSAAGNMTMAGMEMAGMAMQDMGGGQDQQAISETMPHHTSIGEMGPCERHACDNPSAVSAKMNGLGDTHFHLILAVTETLRADDAQALFRGARDDLASFPPHNRNSFQLNLRV
jgi:hypothetical protein